MVFEDFKLEDDRVDNTISLRADGWHLLRINMKTGKFRRTPIIGAEEFDLDSDGRIQEVEYLNDLLAPSGMDEW